MRFKWTLKQLKDEALKHTSRSEFQKNNKPAYMAAWNRGILDTICSHMPPLMESWNFNKALIEALKHKDRISFSIGSPNAYAYSCRVKILDAVCAHMGPPKNIEWADEKLFLEAKKHTSRIDFIKNSPNAYAACTRKGSDFLNKVCAHMLPPKTASFTDEKIRQAASLFNTRNEFQNGQKGAYRAALKKGTDFLNSICAHMEPSKTEAYSLNELRIIAKKYSSRSDFAENESGAHTSALRKGVEFYNDICSHMKKPSVSKPEKTILEEVLKYFPSATKFRATKLKIPGKEYIRTLEVDILVKELGKAIEYDGGWHHSFEGLKRGHPTWPDEDIKNYHEIKNNAFLSLGIEILHITQIDWKKDKNACIKKCLDFLNP